MQKQNKLLVSGFIIMGLLVGISIALTLNNEEPDDLSTVSGDVSAVVFSVDDTDDSATGGTVYIDGLSSWALTCAGTGPTVCSDSIDLSSTPEGEYRFYFFVTDGVSPAYYPADAATGGRFNFTLDKIPLPPSFLSVNGLNETALALTWTASGSTDIDYYNITSNRTGAWGLEGTTNLTSYDSTGLTTGGYYCYNVSAVDLIGQKSTQIGPECSVVADSTPPVDPVVTPVSGSEINITNPLINIDYSAGAEDITLDILTAGSVIKTFSGGMDYNWTPSLADNTTYNFQFNASDVFDNSRLTNYTITVKSGSLFNLSILDTEHITANIFPEKTAVLPGDYIIMGVDISLFPDEYVRMRMDDWTSASDTILISDMDAIFFCEEDYNAGAQDIIASPVKNVYNMSTVYNLSLNALNCTDTNPSALVEYTAYVKATIPVGTDSGAYSFNYGVNSYPNEI